MKAVQMVEHMHYVSSVAVEFALDAFSGHTGSSYYSVPVLLV